MSDRHEQEATITRIEEHTAILRFNEGQEIPWKKTDLPKDIKEGSCISFKIQTVESEKEERSKLAAVVLNELLTP